MNTQVLSKMERDINKLSRKKQLFLIERLAYRLRESSFKEQNNLESQLAAMAKDTEIQRELQKIDVEFERCAVDAFYKLADLIKSFFIINNPIRELLKRMLMKFYRLHALFSFFTNASNSLPVKLTTFRPFSTSSIALFILAQYSSRVSTCLLRDFVTGWTMISTSPVFWKMDCKALINPVFSSDTFKRNTVSIIINNILC